MVDDPPRLKPSPLAPPPFWRTHYFAMDVMTRRRWLQDLSPVDVERIIRQPDRKELQKEDGRTRHWGYAKSVNRYIRLVVEPDGRTVHNAMEDDPPTR